MGSNPKVSICVSVYNNAPYLEVFLDSALRQSFDDYEIVLADNCSTDDSMKILQEYENAFPEKVFVYQTEENRGAASGRNLVFQKSRGAYIYHCDSDDLIHPRAMEMLYNEAVKYDADIVCGYGFEVHMQNDQITLIREFQKTPSMAVDNGQIIKRGTHFWLRLFKRNLLERIGSMPENCIYEDARYLTVVHSYAEVIRFLGFPVYYWYQRGTSTMWSVRKELCEDSIEADKYALFHANPKYLEDAYTFTAYRNRGHLNYYWQYYDLFANYIRQSVDWIYCNTEVKQNKYVLDGLHKADLRMDSEFPNIIYINGFGGRKTYAGRVEELREKVFHEGSKIVVLSEDTCDVLENTYVKRMLDRGETDFVCGYFALKKIYEDGGVYLHDGIRILNPFGFLKYQNAFFAFLDKTTFSEWIFGAPSGNEAIAAILDTYSDSWDKHNDYPPLSERIAAVLTGKYGIPLDGKGRMFGEVVSVIPPELSAVDTRYGSRYQRCAFEHDFSAFAEDAEYVTLKRSSLKTILDNSIAGQKAANAAALQQRIHSLEREKAELEKTNTWKLMMKIRRLGDTPTGKLLKKPFHGLIWVYKKLKRR